MHPLLDMQAHPIVGHRGNAAHAPENTIESFRQAVDLGVDALELDVHLSADGQVVVIHDPTLDRTTSQSGRVDRLTLAEVKRADAGARFTKDRGATWPYRGTGITVPSLDEVLRTFPTTPLLIEIKTESAARATREVIERHGANERCIVASFHDGTKDAFRDSGIAYGASRRDTAGLLGRALFRLPVRAVDFKVMCMPPAHRGLPLPLGGYAAILAPLGVPVHVWTIDDARAADRIRARGVRGIISNDPGSLLASGPSREA
jgi:glycerophosphoryl diester phosphodiesterase